MHQKSTCAQMHMHKHMYTHACLSHTNSIMQSWPVCSLLTFSFHFLELREQRVDQASHPVAKQLFKIMADKCSNLWLMSQQCSSYYRYVCPHQRGVLISEVVLYTSLCSWDSRQCPHQRGALISEVVLCTSLCSWDSRQCPHEGSPYYLYMPSHKLH